MIYYQYFFILSTDLKTKVGTAEKFLKLKKVHSTMCLEIQPGAKMLKAMAIDCAL